MKGKNVWKSSSIWKYMVFTHNTVACSLFYLLWSMSQRLKQTVNCCTENAASWLFTGTLKLFSHCFPGFSRKVFKLQPKLFFPWCACPCQNVFVWTQVRQFWLPLVNNLPLMANFLVVQGLQLLLTVMIYISTLEQEKLLYTKTWQETWK